MHSPSRTNLEDRYQLGEVLGRGGMGVVYKAYDKLLKRDVALKTILDIENTTTLELFYKECGTLAGMVHPNIISIYDIGEFEHEGVRKPFFVMPLLPGSTLDQLIKEKSPRFTVDVLIDIFSQACRGLHAAHEMGLVHRDIKPSNLFVMADSSVKIIDFGIARQASAKSQTSLKGTLAYMPPEQIELKTPTPLCDQYSLAVVCYEALAGRRPFRGSSEGEVVDAILHHNPPPISDLNSNVKYALSQVIHKALAKQPWHRFYTVKEFAEAMQKAVRGEPLEYFDVSKIKPRLERANGSFESGDIEFASEVLTELESEGYLDQGITLLRRRVDQASKQRRVRQLLDSALRYFEATEYPLALRKTQEALELDPENTDVLSLKSRIERERRERKIGEWIRLGREHMENQSFRQAREALDNVIKITPNDTAALGLLAEIERREKDSVKTREKKSSLYEAAMQNWERGDVTAALSKLDVLLDVEKQHPDTDGDRSSSYQSFYNQVRSEHDALKNSLDQARRHLSTDHFDEALEVCKQYLTKYPNHAMFQALHFDIEERRRQKLSSVIAETDRKVDEEPDLDRKVGLLDEALKNFPDEKHFQSALRLVRDKRDLVSAIANKAQYFEERQQFGEALDQWQIIRSIHGAYPGLEFEVERLSNRRDQHARQAARAKAIEDIERYLEACNYEKALSAVRAAMAEFPSDSELPELEKLVLRNQENAVQAAKLLAGARELSDSERVEESLSLLREARSLDPRNSVIRTVLVNTLLETARRNVTQDWEQGEQLIRELLEIQPNHAAAMSLLSQLADQKREDFISWCLGQARRLQVEGDFDGALALVQKGLDADPHEQRLQVLKGSLVRGQTEFLKTSARPSSSGPSSSPGVSSPSSASSPASSSGQSSASAVVSDPAMTPPAVPGTPGQGTPSKLPPPDGMDATLPFVTELDRKKPGAGAGTPGKPRNGGTAPTVEKAIPVFAPGKPPAGGITRETTVIPLPDPSKTGPAGADAAKHKRSWIFAILGAVAVAAILIASFFIGSKTTKPQGNPKVTGNGNVPAAAGTTSVAIHASPAAATILVDGNARGIGTYDARLSDGSHTIEGRLDGYASIVKTLQVKSGASIPPVDLVLTPTPPAAVIQTNLNGATVTIDSGEAAAVQNGELQVKDLPTGAHTIHLKGEGYSANFSFTSAPNAAPALDPLPREAIGVSVAAILGTSGKVESNLVGAEATLDGNSAGKIAATGLTLDNLTPGQHDLVITPTTGPAHHLAFISGTSASLVAFLGADKNVGTLQIEAGEDDATVYVNDVKAKRNTARGGKYVTYLTPGSYKVRVEKTGFQPIQNQVIDLKAGQQSKVPFTLVHLPTTSTLTVRSAPSGAEVLIDNRRVGVVGNDGTWSGSDIAPGSHTIALRKDGFKARPSTQNFTAGVAVELDGSMAATNGTLKVELSPAGVNAKVTYKRDGDDNSKPLDSSLSMNLPEGDYTVSGHLEGYPDATASAHLVGGKTAVAVLTFRSVSSTQPEVPHTTVSLNNWERLGGWKKEGKWLTRHGGGLLLLPGGMQSGRYGFTAEVTKGKRIEWVMGYKDDRNYVLCQIEDDKLIVTPIENGAKLKSQKPLTIKVDRANWVVVEIDVTEHAFTVRVQQEGGGKFTTSSISADLPGGKFGFRIGARDDFSLAYFMFGGK